MKQNYLTDHTIVGEDCKLASQFIMMSVTDMTAGHLKKFLR
jgi:hypothetical protein